MNKTTYTIQILTITVEQMIQCNAMQAKKVREKTNDILVVVHKKTANALLIRLFCLSIISKGLFNDNCVFVFADNLDSLCGFRDFLRKRCGKFIFGAQMT